MSNPPGAAGELVSKVEEAADVARYGTFDPAKPFRRGLLLERERVGRTGTDHQRTDGPQRGLRLARDPNTGGGDRPAQFGERLAAQL